MKIEMDPTPAKADVQALLDNLIRFNVPHLPGIRRKTLAVWLRDDHSRITGGIVGDSIGSLKVRNHRARRALLRFLSENGVTLAALAE